jgi:hypothetical protein
MGFKRGVVAIPKKAEDMPLMNFLRPIFSENMVGPFKK